MDTRKSARHSVRGAVRPVFIAIGHSGRRSVAAWILIIASNREAVEQQAVVTNPASKAAAAQARPTWKP